MAYNLPFRPAKIAAFAWPNVVVTDGIIHRTASAEVSIVNKFYSSSLGLFGLGRGDFSLQVGAAALALLHLIVLFAHKSLYNVIPIRKLGRDYDCRHL